MAVPALDVDEDEDADVLEHAATATRSTAAVATRSPHGRPAVAGQRSGDNPTLLVPRAAASFSRHTGPE